MKLHLFLSTLLLGLLVGVGMWAAGPSHPEAWTSGYETNKPDTSDPVNQGDDHIRTLKQELRARLRPEHHFSNFSETSGTADAASDDTGLHRLGSARCFYGTTAPTELEHRDNPPGATTSGGVKDLTVNASAGSENLGIGRCWVDTDGADNDAATTEDNHAINVWDGSAWVTPGVGAAAWPEGYIKGLETSPSGSDGVAVAAGKARVGTAADQDLINCTLSAGLSKTLGTSGPWVVGTGNLGQVTGSTTYALDVWYHVFLVCTKAGVGEIAIDSDINFVNGLSDIGATYPYFRRIGSVEVRPDVTDLKAWVQSGDNFRWSGISSGAAWLDYNTTTVVGSNQQIALSHTPPGLKLLTRFTYYTTGNANYGIAWNSGDGSFASDPPAIPGSSAFSPMNQHVSFGTAQLSNTTEQITDTSQQVTYRINGAFCGPCNNLQIQTQGWVDPRGRL